MLKFTVEIVFPPTDGIKSVLSIQNRYVNYKRFKEPFLIEKCRYNLMLTFSRWQMQKI